MFSEVDFERANSDMDEDDASYYVEEEVTDEEAMEKQRQEIRSQREADGEDPDETDDSIGYMPSLLQKSGSAQKSKPKLQKITKKVTVKKKKPTSTKKPPRQASPPLGRTAASRNPMSDN